MIYNINNNVPDARDIIKALDKLEALACVEDEASLTIDQVVPF